MRGPRGWRQALGVGSLAATFTLGGVRVGTGESNVRLRGEAGMAVRRSIERALLRLDDPACRHVFTDFNDGAGRPLQAALDGLGATPRSYLGGLLLFYDGSAHSRCAGGEILGSAQPGSRVVYVCPLQFVSAYRRDKLLSETFIIHEMLHSLGLGENPPASLEINSAVMKRCGGAALGGSVKPVVEIQVGQDAPVAVDVPPQVGRQHQ